MSLFVVAGLFLFDHSYGHPEGMYQPVLVYNLDKYPHNTAVSQLTTIDTTGENEKIINRFWFAYQL